MIPAARNVLVRPGTLVLPILAALTVGALASVIVQGKTSSALLSLVGVAVVFIGIAILNDWRTGVYLSLIWLLFEDLVRKYLGNNLYVYFAKDALVAFTYVAFVFALRRERKPRFRPVFLVPLWMFFLLACLQVFNPQSPSVLYGLLGLKLYFYYTPMMFVGYHLIRTEVDLKRFLLLGVVLGAIIASVGIAQAALGVSFLSPAELAPELRALGELQRMSPVTQQIVPNPSSVFVSAGRFSYYLIMIWIVALGTLAYLYLKGARRAIPWLLLFGLISLAVLLSGGRLAFISVIVSALIMAAAFLRRAPWRRRGGNRLVRAVQHVLALTGIALFLLWQFNPSAVGVSWAFYSETLLPTSPGSELAVRGWEYPLKNIGVAFDRSDWPVGNGTGTASFGAQYVERLLREPGLTVGIEGGFGTMMFEMGILGPALWLAWSGVLLVSGWRALRLLRMTRYYPVGFAILWFSFLLLIPFNFYSQQYQNFVYNFHFWLLVGIFFRLPGLAAQSQMQNQPAPGPLPVRSNRWSPAEVRR